MNNTKKDIQTQLDTIALELQDLNKRIANVASVQVKDDWNHYVKMRLLQTLIEQQNRYEIKQNFLIKTLATADSPSPHQANIQEKRITKEMIAQAKEYPFDRLIKVNRYGMALCPFHEDHNPSFHVKHNRAKCYGCGWKGDVIAFVMAKYSLTFKEAVKRLIY